MFFYSFLLDFVNHNTSIDIVPDKDLLNKSFMKLIRKYNSSFLSVDDMTLINDDITMLSKPSIYHEEINNRLMSINEQHKGKHNHLIDSANIIRSKPRREMTCIFCKQKAYKVTNCDRRLLIGKEVDGNDLIH